MSTEVIRSIATVLLMVSMAVVSFCCCVALYQETRYQISRFIRWKQERDSKKEKCPTCGKPIGR